MKRVIIGLLFMLIGGAVISWSSRATTKIPTSKTWPTTRGTVLSSAVVVDSTSPGGSNKDRYEADVRYRFAVNGQTYESNVIVPGVPKSFADRTMADKALGAYPKDGDVTVYYDPANPARSVLEHGSPTQNIGLTTLTGSMFLLMGLLLSIAGALGWARSELIGR
jgi:hypothetical protein